ncbi:MAG TPA: apolipoprotein N-acyltransferase [Vicinamibacterales bacterium]|nr:apolipoprotein N-acyltransferase [Vicinamibacterales bacterium]
MVIPFDYALALVSGALLALSFPRYGHPAFAWIALVPLLVALTGWNGRTPSIGEGRGASGQPPLRAFLLGLASGFVYFAGTLYWTGTVIRTFGGIPLPAAALGVVLLALYQGFFPALFALLASRLIARAGIGGLLFAPAAWVATEFSRGVVLGGFPWVLLGSSQVTVLPVAQLASVVGVYGVSGLVALINATIAYATLTTGRRRIASIATGAVVLVATAVWGTLRIADGTLTRVGTPIRVAMIQANIPQEDKWKAGEARRIFTTYIAMTRDAAKRGAEFVIWPESATPFMFERDPVGQEALRTLARELKVPILFGSDQEVTQPEPALYNAAFMVAPDGRTAAVYRKIHLVPWGEFIPMKRLLFFVSPLVDSFTDFSPGTSMVMLPVGSHLTSTAICYEVVYPSLVRQAVLAGSQLLTTITNDAWYGYSSAPYQHFALASMRAIEQGRYLARAANTGISGIVDPYGRIVRQSGIFEQVALVEEARFLTVRTIYSRIGDVIAYVAIAIVAIGLVALRR